MCAEMACQSTHNMATSETFPGLSSPASGATNIMFDPTEHPHRRYNPLHDSWVLGSPQRARRPWQGQQEHVDDTPRPSHDPGCYLCPGNTRIGGEVNPDYTQPYVFPNDFPALLPDTPEYRSDDPLLKSMAVRGTARVICFSPDHVKTLPHLSRAAI